MVSMASLWLPILLSAVFAFIVSSVVHMLLTYHRSDLVKLPGEDGIGEALRQADVPPGDYMIPHAKDMKEAQTPEMIKKFESGPVAILTVYPNGPIATGKALGQWFVYLVLANVVVAYLASRTVAANAEYLQIFRVAGTAAFLCFAGAAPIATIWKGQKGSTTVKNMFDGLLYALMSAGCFAGFWPH
jgi:hypothetical protein